MLGALALVLHFIPEADAKRGADGHIARKGSLDAFAIEVGDCFQTPATGDDRIDTVAAVPCAQSHTAQVLSSYTYVYTPADVDPMAPTDIDPMPPAENQIRSDSIPVCEKAVAEAVDPARMPAGLRVDVLVPSGMAWFVGHHDVLCAVVGAGPWTGSVMKSQVFS